MQHWGAQTENYASRKESLVQKLSIYQRYSVFIKSRENILLGGGGGRSRENILGGGVVGGWGGRESEATKQELHSTIPSK